MKEVSIPQKRGRPRNRPAILIADKGYDSDKIRSYLRGRGIKSMIPQKKLRPGTKRRKKGPRPKFDDLLYKERNEVERLIGKLKIPRRIAMRFEKLAQCFLAMIKVAFIKFYLKKCLSDTT